MFSTSLLGFVRTARKNIGAVHHGSHAGFLQFFSSLVWDTLIYKLLVGFFYGGHWPSILNGKSLLEDVAESLNQWPVAK